MKFSMHFGMPGFQALSCAVGVALALAACGDSVNTPNTLSTKGDPLYQYQWHLKNTGQPVIADILPTPGVDLNIGSLHDEGVRGKGVIVGVIDSGIDASHEDLSDNIISQTSANFLVNGSNPGPVDGVAHGTEVAGVIAAVADNGKGGRGVAPEAKLIDFNATIFGNNFEGRFTALITLSDYFSFLIHSLNDAQGVQIYNYSKGAGGLVRLPLMSSFEQVAMLDTLSSMRHGKGAVFVRAAGNEFSSLVDSSNGTCLEAGKYLTCAAANFDPTTAIPNFINVASVNSNGHHAFNSTAGSVLWISGLGGEMGGAGTIFWKKLLRIF